jgi:hypothetical protein
VFSHVEGVLRFHPATLSDEDFQAVQRSVRTRCLRAAVRHGALTEEAAEDLSHWAHGGGFSLHAGVLIEAEDRAALERLLRYCARPALASERLEVLGQGADTERGDERIRYTLPKPTPDGQTSLTLTPLELLDRLAALIPPPRRHRHHYHGVLAPHSPLRQSVTACAGQAITAKISAGRAAARSGPAAPADPVMVTTDEPTDAPASTPARRQAAFLWVRLLARIYDVLPLVCPRCGGETRLIAFMTQPAAIGSILTHLGEPITPPPLAPRARAPPEFEDTERALMLDQSPVWDLTVPAPERPFEFNQEPGA